jgi:peptidoglycan/xylan/chitin deacetylase (PgdA/CDA1 family)
VSKSHACDQARTARLLFASELADGVVGEDKLSLPEVRRATRVKRVPSRGVRVAQQIRHKLGWLTYEKQVAAPQVAARRAVLADRADGGPRLLVRVDEFPHYRAWDDPARFGVTAFERFHEIMAGAGVPYLIAALPRVSREPLSPQPLGSRPLEDEEVEELRRVAGEGVTLGLHGLDHRTRHSSPRRHSELCGLDAHPTDELLKRALAELEGHGLPAPSVFVAPYNRFDAPQLDILARRFAVVCGGPESIGKLGFHRTPQWRGHTVYLPSYAPFYGHAAEVLAALEEGEERLAGLWTPVVLHWGWEAEAGWRELERLAARMAGLAAPWGEFLDAVERSREGGAPS